MPFSKFILIPVFIALQAFILMLIAAFIPGTTKAVGGPNLLTWITFQAWAMYFLGGCTPKMAMKTAAGYLGGIIASIAIFELNGLLSSLNAGATPWGLYLAVFIVVIPVIVMEKVPGLDFIPAWFIGAGVFFALMTYCKPPEGLGKWAWYGRVATPEMIACVVGLIFGWVTVTFRGWYEKKVGPAEKAAA